MKIKTESKWLMFVEIEMVAKKVDVPDRLQGRQNGRCLARSKWSPKRLMSSTIKKVDVREDRNGRQKG
jgi:hypothetical protein